MTNRDDTNAGNKTISQMADKELADCIKIIIEGICDKVRNKMVAPYLVILDLTGGVIPSEDLITASKKSIEWLCYEYIPEVLDRVSNQPESLPD